MKAKKEKVLDLIKNHPEGLTIQNLSKLAKLSRITATKYVERLIGEGKVEERKIGVYRLLFPTERFLESIKEEKIIEKLKKKLE